MKVQVPEEFADHPLMKILAPALVLDQMAMTSGTLPEVKRPMDSPEEQVVQSLQNMMNNLRVCGHQPSDLFYVLIFTTETINANMVQPKERPGFYPTINAAWDEYVLSQMGGKVPCRAVIGVTELPAYAKVEVIGFSWKNL